MRSCILLFYIAALAGPAWAQSADSLYADRANLASARRAAMIWTEELRVDPTAFESAWKLARARYWLGGHAPQPERRGFLEAGIEAARKAVALEPNRPEGHFWLAANMGTLAESFGLRAGLKYRGAVKNELETVLRLDPSFLNGSADRVLGRWYDRVPGLLGGSDKKAEAHLRESLKYSDHNTVSLFFLAELLLNQGRKVEARAELQKILDAPVDPEWAPEDADYKEKARALLAKRK
jgi:tetratricopeptide (TPR) repeat protein